MTPPAYRLEWNYFHHRPDDIVCRIVEFPGWNQSTRLAAIKPRFQPSEPVEFDTHFALLEDAPDYPNNTARWPVMSRRMLDVLLSVREFAHNAIPVTLVQDTIPVEVRYDANGRPKPEYSKSDYVAVQLLDYADVFDVERSVFHWSEIITDRAGLVSKYAFRVPPEGLPPLFRMQIFTVALFVSAEARAALEAAGIHGPKYRRPDEL